MGPKASLCHLLPPMGLSGAASVSPCCPWLSPQPQGTAASWMSPGCSKAPAQAAMPHHGVGTMPGCASTGAASAELLGRCHPGCWSQLAQGQVPGAGQHRGEWVDLALRMPTASRAGGWTGCAATSPQAQPRALGLGPFPDPGGGTGASPRAAAGDPGSQLCPQPPGQGSGAVATRAGSPSRGAADWEGCSPASGAVGAAVQSVTSTPALSPAAEGLFLLWNVPSPRILAGCRACVTGERLRPGPAGG